MSDYTLQKFSWAKALWKGVTTALYIAGPLGLMLTQITEQAPALPSDTSDPTTMWSWLLAFGLVCFRVGLNVFKHRDKKGNPLYSLIFPLSFLAFTVGFSGCTTYGYSFIDTDGASMTMHANTFVSKMDKSMASANYVWDKDGAGHWAVGGGAEGMDSTDALATLQGLMEMLTQMQALKAAQAVTETVAVP